jgi:hypothetical protein
MNTWSMQGNYIENQRAWGTGGRALSAIASASHGSIVPQYSIHPQGRSDEYRAKNRRIRYTTKLHGQGGK